MNTTAWPPIILASQSPRRRELLSDAHLTFDVLSVPVEESIPYSMEANQVAIHIATTKVKAVVGAYPQQAANSLIIAADTIVVLNNTILGKPKNEQQATEYLQALSGRAHQVVTGISYYYKGIIETLHCVTKVYFNTLSLEQINFYIKNYQPYDKAGAYAIQEWIGLVGIDKIEGSYHNVVGLPVSQMLRHIKRTLAL